MPIPDSLDYSDFLARLREPGPTPWPQVLREAVEDLHSRVGSSATYTVIGRDAPAWMRVPGNGRYLCSGTRASGGDQVQLQAAIDEAKANGPGRTNNQGGVVRIIGTLYVSKAAGQTDIVISDCTFTGTTGVISGITFSGEATIADVEVGQLFRIRDGDTGGDTLEDKHEDHIGTVTAKTADPDTITLDTRTYETYTGVNARRMTCAVNLNDFVYLEGDGVNHATIMLADSQDCDVVHYERVNGAYTGAGFGLRNLAIDGNKANQGDKVSGNFDWRCNGVVVNANHYDLQLHGVNVISCKGDAMHINQPWGCRILDGWFEHCDGGGIFLTGSGGAKITGTKVNANAGPALVLLKGQDNFINMRVLGTEGDITTAAPDAYTRDEYALKIIGGYRNSIVNTQITDGATTDAAGGVYLSGALENVISGCNIWVEQTGNAGITFGTRSSYDNVILGNVFDPACADPIAGLDAAGTWHSVNIIRDNVSQWYEDRQEYFWVINRDGSQVDNKRLVVRKEDGFGTSTTLGDGRVLGVTVLGNAADDARHRVLTRGYCYDFPTDDGENISVGDPLGNGTVAGLAKIATSGKTAIAIALSADGAGTPGQAAYIRALLVEPFVVS